MPWGTKTPKPPAAIAGKTSDFIEFPTIIARAGLTLPQQVISGHDLAPLIKDPAAPWSHPVLTTWRPDNHSIRTATHTFIRYKNGDQELYDDANDPDQINNLATDKAQTTTITNLNSQLEALLKKNNATSSPPATSKQKTTRSQ